MKNFTSKLVLTSGVLSLALAPVIAQANTRAGDLSPLFGATTAAANVGVNPSLVPADENDDEIILLLVGGAALGAGIFILASDEGDENQSPGT